MLINVPCLTFSSSENEASIMNSLANNFFFHNIGCPITTEHITSGLSVSVLVLPADPKLLTKKALHVVGPQAFQLKDVHYHKPKPLSDWTNHCNDSIDLFLFVWF